ncbi:MAG: hypothetical protein ACYDIA_12245 [Candidatus Humimicrobiaceae bacterium]
MKFRFYIKNINIKKHRNKIILHLSVIIFFFILSFIINRFPQGSYIAGGDWPGFIPTLENLKNFSFTWHGISQGGYSIFNIGFPFWAFQYVLYNLGFSLPTIANLIIFLFLIGSFYNFFFALEIICAGIKLNIKFLASLVYALNIFTFIIFTGTVVLAWGYSGFFFIYIFIPLIFALFIKTINNFTIKNVLSFSVLFFISAISYMNPAFLFGLFFLEFLFFLIIFFRSKIGYKFKTFRNATLIFIIQLFLCSYFFVPWVIDSFSSIPQLVQGGVLLPDYLTVIKNNSFSIINTFSLSNAGYYFPSHNLYFNLEKINLIVPFSLGYIFVLILSLFFQKKKQEKEWINFMIFFLLLFFLLMRFTPPFDKINYYIYKIPIFGVFRSPEKLFVFLPFFFIILLALLLNFSKFSKKVTSILLIILILIPFPFYIGGIPKYLGSVNIYKASHIIKIPDDYLAIKSILNKENLDLSIIDLPPNYETNVWQRYPELNYYGVTPFGTLYKNRYIITSTFEHLSLANKSFEDYNLEGKTDINKFLGLIQKFSGKYILIHKDLDKESMDHSVLIYETIFKLESLDIIKKIEDNNHFTLFELDKKYLVPLISSDNNTKLYFQKISPVKYKIYISGLKEKTNIEFHQSYHLWWKIYINSYSKNNWLDQNYYYANTNTIEYKPDFRVIDFEDFSYLWKNSIFDKEHSLVKGYANNWEISTDYIKNNFPNKFYKENSDGSIDISLTFYFKDQIYFYSSLILIGLFFSSLVAYMIFKKIKIRKKNNEYR